MPPPMPLAAAAPPHFPSLRPAMRASQPSRRSCFVTFTLYMGDIRHAAAGTLCRHHLP